MPGVPERSGFAASSFMPSAKITNMRRLDRFGDGRLPLENCMCDFGDLLRLNHPVLE